ncbi:MAG: deoxyribose-phosphate aldolase [Weeksellaceae bacterium]
MGIESYLDSTYLKTPQQSGLTDSETLEKVHQLTKEAIEHHFFAVMIRPDYVRSIRMQLDKLQADVKLGTVIDFPEGKGSLDIKLNEAQIAIANGADELDFVADYTAFKKGETEKVKEEIEACSRWALKANKVVKWIIETAALTDDEIMRITKLIRDVVLDRLSDFPPEKVFVKSSTGFFETPNGEPNGANLHVIQLMLKHAGPLSVKAAGGVRTKEDALEMIQLGVNRIGTSSALKIVNG